MRRYELTDEQWAKIEGLLPAQKPKTGRPNLAHRQVVNRIVWVLKSGALWRDLPERYGKVGTVSSRFYRWMPCAARLKR
jgi:transposase